MAEPFLDTNVLLRHLLGDNPEWSPRASAYLGRIERGELRVRITDSVVFAVVFKLERRYHRPKADIRDAVLPLIEMPGIILPGKQHLRKVFDLYVDKNVSFADAYHVVLMERLGIGEVVSFDAHFDRIPSLRRVEP
ncbi:MAG: PIN domain-containing protein [Chloroflexi bacterium]|nr:PIN domain-containing protein [Chloroflexota bacterium]